MSRRHEIWGFDPATVSAVNATIVSAIAKHGVERTPLNSEMANSAKLAILVEEVGEVAHAMTYDGDSDKLVKELLQVAAMALAWAEALDSKGETNV